MSLTTEQKQTWKIQGRYTKDFYSAATGKLVTGISTQEERCYWVPEEGYSLWVGKHLFATKAEANEQRRKELREEIAAAQKELAALGEPTLKHYPGVGSY